MGDRQGGGSRRPGHSSSVIPAKRGADSQEEKWVAEEDIFVLKQAKKKAEIRIKDGRARPIDWLAVILRLIDPERDLLDDEVPDSDLDIVDPDGVFEDLSEKELSDLEKDIDTYIALERKRDNRDYWNVRYGCGALVFGTITWLTFTTDDEDNLQRPSTEAQRQCPRGTRGQLSVGGRRSPDGAQVVRGAGDAREANQQEARLQRADRRRLLGATPAKFDRLESPGQAQAGLSVRHR